MEYDKTKFKIWTWKNPIMLHWIINPGLVINELLLGQRVPKIMLIEKDSTKSLQEKTKILRLFHESNLVAFRQL